MINFDIILESGNRGLFINQLLMTNKETMMGMIYKAVIENKMGALASDIPKSNKVEGLTKLLKWFEFKEEYEKCGILKTIIEQL